MLLLLLGITSMQGIWEVEIICADIYVKGAAAPTQLRVPQSWQCSTCLMSLGGASAHSGSREEVLLCASFISATPSLEELHSMGRLDTIRLLSIFLCDLSHEELAVIDELVYLGQVTGQLDLAKA